ncbi:MAG TPA: hypothetical protein VGY54_06440, partial [Polyangiaceae bacterium]|nr:hypothetical protein [Polyangiaceae bacterium]
MRRFSLFFTTALASAFVGNLLLGCAGHAGSHGFTSEGSSVASGGSSVSAGASSSGSANGSVVVGSNGSLGNVGDGGAVPAPITTPAPGDGGVPCPPGLACNVPCGGGTSTTITGKVYDPAGKNPLYNVAVYVPATALQPLPKGVLTGADACSCPSLFKSGALAATSTAVDGTFTLTNVPVGEVTLVLQVGKWRRAIKITTTSCQANAQPDKSLKLPGTLAGACPDDNMPDIAVSTGSADTLECLMTRIGVPGTEYVAGTGTTGHVHIFSGGNPKGGGLLPIFGGGGVGGRPERHPMPGAPSSPTALWMTQAQLMPYDITLLSCEGEETFNANPAALEAYLNAGGRAFGSHFHYAWFSGPIGTMQNYVAPPDWGTNLANWTVDMFLGSDPVGGVIETTLNGTTNPFPKGVVLKQWLAGVGALGTDGVPAADLAIFQPKYNAVVVAADKPSQAWITSDPGMVSNGGDGGSSGGNGGSMNPQTMYFSFDTPVNAPSG